MPDNTPHEPTEKTRTEVAALSSFGNTQEEIASYLEIHVNTLIKYYRRELDTAVIKANAMVARGLFNKAVQQDDLSAQIFWLKTRGRWRTADSEHDLPVDKSQLKEIAERVAAMNKESEKEY